MAEVMDTLVVKRYYVVSFTSDRIPTYWGQIHSTEYLETQSESHESYGERPWEENKHKGIEKCISFVQ